MTVAVEVTTIPRRPAEAPLPCPASLASLPTVVYPASKIIATTRKKALTGIVCNIVPHNILRAWKFVRMCDTYTNEHNGQRGFRDRRSRGRHRGRHARGAKNNLIEALCAVLHRNVGARIRMMLLPIHTSSRFRRRSHAVEIPACTWVTEFVR